MSVLGHTVQQRSALPGIPLILRAQSSDGRSVPGPFGVLVVSRAMEPVMVFLLTRLGQINRQFAERIGLEFHLLVLERSRVRSEVGFTVGRLGRFMVAFYSDAVTAAILIFSSGNSVSVAIRTFLGSSS